MRFNDNSSLAGMHAFLSASKYHWINYSEEKLIRTYTKARAAEQGTRLHDFAKECIELGQKLPRSRKSLNSHVNDAIGYRMSPEVVLFYSQNAFGTADAICFRKNLLRIHDLKTGLTKPSMVQLLVYASLFCLEYDKLPHQIDMELRIYFNSEILVHVPEPMEIRQIMDKIVYFDNKIDEIEEAMEEPWAI